MSRRHLTALTALIWTLCIAVGRANGIATSIQPQGDSPVTIVGCNAGLQHVSNGYGTDFYRLSMSARFKNESTKTAVAVMVHFQLANAFGDVLGDRFGQSTGTFSSNVEIDGERWSDTDIWPGLGEVKCSISRVLFQDGSTWPQSTVAPSL